MLVLWMVFDMFVKLVKKVWFYVIVRGIYDFYINGKCVSDDYYNLGFM